MELWTKFSQMFYDVKKKCYSLLVTQWNVKRLDLAESDTYRFSQGCATLVKMKSILLEKKNRLVEGGVVLRHISFQSLLIHIFTSDFFLHLQVLLHLHFHKPSIHLIHVNKCALTVESDDSNIKHTQKTDSSTVSMTISPAARTPYCLHFCQHLIKYYQAYKWILKHSMVWTISINVLVLELKKAI